jgi:eukaryotic-like serine/threonine-protein kinase
MTLAVGSCVGPFEVSALIGEGGMGRVFRAHDTKLQRDVALKVLPEDFSSDSDRVARFHREAQVLAALNHPNIAQIYGFEDSTAERCLVLELVEGETLEDRLRNGRLPVEEALRFAKQIADALEAAHERGVIHRDLKPANIKINAEDKLKVLDFGLARIFDDQAPSSSSLSQEISQEIKGATSEVTRGVECRRHHNFGSKCGCRA